MRGARYDTLERICVWAARAACVSVRDEEEADVSAARLAPRSVTRLCRELP